MNIETKWLEDFLSLSTTQSFSRSAEERHLTQPAFSRRIRTLESAVGCELVDRSQVPVRLTEGGRLFLITARNLVSQLNDTINHIASLEAQSVKVVDFAVSHTLSLSFFPGFLLSLRAQLEGISSRQLVANVDESVQALKNGICDFLLAFEEPTLSSDQFHKLKLQTEYLIPVCQPGKNGEPLFNLDAPQASILPCLRYPDNIFLGRCVTNLLASPPHPVELRNTFESSMADSLKVMAMQGAGIAWVPTFAVSEELRLESLVHAGGYAWELPLEIYLYRSNRRLPPHAEALWDELESRYAAS